MSPEQYPHEITKSISLIDINRHEQAIQKLQNLLACGYLECEVFYLLAICHSQLEKPTLALQNIQKAIEINPINAEYFNIAAVVHLQLNQYKNAEHFIKQAIELNPQESDYFYTYAKINYFLLNYRQALEKLSISLSLNPNDSESHQLKGLIYLAIAKKDQGIESILESLKQDPTDPLSLAFLGSHYIESGNKEEGQRLIQSALRIDPSNEAVKFAMQSAKKNDVGILSFFLNFGFNHYFYEITFWNILMIIIGFKGLLLLGPIFAIFIMTTWYIDVAYNSIQRRQLFFRNLLSKEQIIQSNFFVAMNILIVFAILSSFLWHLGLHLAIMLLFICIIGISIFECKETWTKIISVLYILFYLKIALTNIYNDNIMAFMFISSIFLSIYGLFFTIRFKKKIEI